MVGQQLPSKAFSQGHVRFLQDFGDKDAGIGGLVSAVILGLQFLLRQLRQLCGREREYFACLVDDLQNGRPRCRI